MSKKNAIILGPVVGGLSDSHVNLWARASGPGFLYAWLATKKDLGDAHLAGKSWTLRAEDGFAGVAPLDGLAAETKYYYALTLDANKKPPPEEFHQFTTFPLVGEPRPFSFAFGSCFRPDKEGGGKIFDAIAQRQPEDFLRFILLIGDQIYADAWEHNGLWQYNKDHKKVAVSLQDYRNVYQYTFSQPPFRKSLYDLPAFMTLDDHEVDDDWRWTDSNRLTANIPWWDKLERALKGRRPEEWRIPLQRVQNALQAYWEHQSMHAPPMTMPPGIDKNGQYILERHAPGSLAYTFNYGAAAFFVMDTRTMRVKRCLGETKMLGDDQWHALKEWLLKVKDYPVKFLVTSASVLFTMWTDIPRDRWSGFPAERDHLLRFIGENDIQGVHFLAGDLHSAHAISAVCGPRKSPIPIWEFCSTPFEQKTNCLAGLMYIPILTGSVRKQRVHFWVAENNFGVVRVAYKQGKAHLEFQLYGEEAQEIGKKLTT